MRVLLIQPPQGDPAQPYTSLGILNAAWKQAGLEVYIADLNLDFYNYLCEPETIRLAIKETKDKLLKNRLNDDEERKAYEQSIVSEDWLETLSAKAIQIFKDQKKFYDPYLYAWAFRAIKRTLYSISAAFYPGEISMQTFRCSESYLSSRGILAATKDIQTNSFLFYCENRGLSHILVSKPEVVAISVTFQTQMIPAWTLADQIKQRFPEIKVVLGGATISRIYGHLLKSPDLFQSIDGFIVFEGETAFPALLNEWERGHDGLAAPNVVLLSGGKPIQSKKSHIEDLDSLPSPDHGCLPLEKYWCPEPALLLNVSRGCYHGLCSFCMISPATWGPHRSNKKYRVRSAEKVVEDIIHINKQTGAKAINLANDVLSPRDLYRIGNILANKKLDVTWDTEIRLERGLTRDILEKMYEGGCRHLRFGFEAASQRVINLMNKRIDHRITQRIIYDCKDIGISVSLMCQVGFPGETKKEALETFKYLRENAPFVSFISVTPFVLELGSKIFLEPEKYSISILHNSLSEDLSWMFRYKRSDGITVEDTYNLYTEIDNSLDKIYPDRDLFFKGGLGHAHTTLYSRHFGPETFLKWNINGSFRDPISFREDLILRTSLELSIQYITSVSNSNWSSVIISAGEMPEYCLRFNTSILVILWMALQPVPAIKLINLALSLSYNTLNFEEAKEIIRTLYQGGFLLNIVDHRKVDCF